MRSCTHMNVSKQIHFYPIYSSVLWSLSYCFPDFLLCLESCMIEGGVRESFQKCKEKERKLCILQILVSTFKRKKTMWPLNVCTKPVRICIYLNKFIFIRYIQVQKVLKKCNYKNLNFVRFFENALSQHRLFTAFSYVTNHFNVFHKWQIRIKGVFEAL